MMALSKVIVVGAGPSGLLLTVLLAKSGINVELLEMSTELDTNPRASHYNKESCHEFDRAGVLDQIRAEGFFPHGASWRKMDEKRTRIASTRILHEMDADDPKNSGRYQFVSLPLHRLDVILLKAAEAQNSARILFGHQVVDLGQTSDKAWVQVQTPEGLGIKEADYVIGCDGANSKVRRLLFGDGVFPGKTWEEQIVATNMYYDFSPYDYDDSQFFVDREHWHMVAKLQNDGLHRVTYGEVGGLTKEELRERQPGKFEAMLPGNPTAEQYQLVNFSPYRVHQRCVDRMRVGRVLLAADAAHLCNPFGGLGLTGGIADVGSLYDSLVGIHLELADESILDKYDEVRRKIWRDIIDPVSSENMERLFKQDPDKAASDDPFLKILNDAETDEEIRRKLHNSTAMSLKHDMTRYYSIAKIDNAGF